MGDEPGQSSVAEIVFFLDENHCRNMHVVQAIEESGFVCEKHLDHFPPGIEDTERLPVVAIRGWCLVTADARIRSNLLEKEAIRVHGVKMFYFSRNNLAGKRWALRSAAHSPKMRHIAETQAPPFIASISKMGEVTLRDTFDASRPGGPAKGT